MSAPVDDGPLLNIGFVNVYSSQKAVSAFTCTRTAGGLRRHCLSRRCRSRRPGRYCIEPGCLSGHPGNPRIQQWRHFQNINDPTYWRWGIICDSCLRVHQQFGNADSVLGRRSIPTKRSARFRCVDALVRQARLLAGQQRLIAAGHFYKFASNSPCLSQRGGGVVCAKCGDLIVGNRSSEMMRCLLFMTVDAQRDCSSNGVQRAAHSSCLMGRRTFSNVNGRKLKNGIGTA